MINKTVKNKTCNNKNNCQINMMNKINLINKIRINNKNIKIKIIKTNTKMIN